MIAKLRFAMQSEALTIVKPRSFAMQNEVQGAHRARAGRAQGAQGARGGRVFPKDPIESEALRTQETRENIVKRVVFRDRARENIVKRVVFTDLRVQNPRFGRVGAPKLAF